MMNLNFPKTLNQLRIGTILRNHILNKSVNVFLTGKLSDFDYIDKWLRLDYFGLSTESVGAISLLLDKENNLKFDDKKQTEPDSENSLSKEEREKKEKEIIDFRESVLTAKIEAVLAIVRGNMKGYPRWISIKSGFQKYRYLSFRKLENQFFSYYITEGNIKKLESLELFFDIHLRNATSKKFTGSLKIYNELKNKIRDIIETIPERKF